MDIWIHTLATTILVIILWPFFGIWSVLAILGGVLIDIDHVIWFWASTGRIDIKYSYNQSKKLCKNKSNKVYDTFILPFHTFDSFLIILITAIIWPPLMPLFIGLLVHLLLDIIHTINVSKRPYFFNYFRRSTLIFLYNWLFKNNPYKKNRFYSR